MLEAVWKFIKLRGIAKGFKYGDQLVFAIAMGIINFAY